MKLNDAIPGDDLRLEGGKGKLAIRVSCPNWLDIDRVQVLLNGRPDTNLNFTRKTHPELFGDKALKFEHTANLVLDNDTHVIVVAIGEESEVGDVMGPNWGRQKPAAVSNPIFVDVDGGGLRQMAIRSARRASESGEAGEMNRLDVSLTNLNPFSLSFLNSSRPHNLHGRYFAACRVNTTADRRLIFAVNVSCANAPADG